MMENIIGEKLASYRVELDLTQDEFGAKYGISGPAVFKFEKGYVKPSLDLWLFIAKDLKIDERKSVLIWAKSRLPEKYQDFIDINAVSSEGSGIHETKESTGIDYSKFADRKEMRKQLLKDTTLQKGLRDLVADEELWTIYKPTGTEINFLRNTYGKIGQGTKNAFRESLRLYREFKGEVIG